MRARGKKRGSIPDVLFHATRQSHFDRCIETSRFTYKNNRSIFLSRTEGHAWQVAHRQFNQPQVLVIDVPRAIRAGVRFKKNPRNLWETTEIPSSVILNTYPTYEEQLSAGGFPVRFSKGEPEVALIQMKRGQMLTWEVAKGKLELTETPLQAAKRELQEEMGVDLSLSMLSDLGVVQFCMMIPPNNPKLKSLFLYVFECLNEVDAFNPATNEGIIDIKWFPVSQLPRVITHRSLRIVLRSVMACIQEEAHRRSQPSTL